MNIAYGLPVYIIYNHTLNRTEHFGVKTPNNTYVDCDGEQREWLRNFRRRDFYSHPDQKLSIMQYTNGINIPDIIINMDASQKLAKLFKPEPLTKTIHTLHEGLLYKKKIKIHCTINFFNYICSLFMMNVKGVRTLFYPKGLVFRNTPVCFNQI